MDKTDLRNKILYAYLKSELDIKSVIKSFESFTEEEKEYAESRMIIKIEDISEKEKAITDVFRLIGEISVEDSFEESDDNKEKIQILNDILIYIQG